MGPTEARKRPEVRKTVMEVDRTEEKEQKLADARASKRAAWRSRSWTVVASRVDFDEALFMQVGMVWGGAVWFGVTWCF